MIGSNNYAENLVPTIILTDEESNNNIHDQSTLELEEQNNNNYPIIESPALDYCQRNDQFNGNFICLSNDVINLDDIPISALRAKSRDLLSKRLNGIKVILSEDGAPRDWRGILNAIGQSDAAQTVQSKLDPMKEVLELWTKNQKTYATIGKLQHILGNIDRWDVVDDTSDFFFDDSKLYLEAISKNKSKETNSQALQIENDENVAFDDSSLLTIDDIKLHKQGKGPQLYHAFILFDESDINFALQIIDTLEAKGLKLCSKERDLIGGAIEMDAIMRVISERCERLIVIFSTAFFQSAANTFFVKFAQALGIEQRKRKIIPCMKDNCNLPPELRFYYVLRYTEKKTYYDFWERLATSIQDVHNVRTSSPAIMPRITITEIESPSSMVSSEIDLQAELADKTKKHFQTPNSLSIQPKQSKSSKSSPTTPISLKKLWNNLPKINSQSTISSSTWTIGVTDQIFDKENERCHSSLSLNNSTTSTTPTKFKKTKPFGFVKKWLSPAATDYKLSAESDSSVGADNPTKKKKWYRKRFRNHSKNREAVKEV